MKKNILVVEDDDSVRQMLRRVLEEEGYGVKTTAGGAEALACASATTMDLALLDLNLASKEGWDLFERLGSDDPLLPIIVITARANQSFRSVVAGAGALMEKPLDFPKLLDTVRGSLNETASARAARMIGRNMQFGYHPGASTSADATATRPSARH